MTASNVAVPSAMDSLSQALRTNIIPNQEYLLQGSILDSAVEHLLHRLKGLCDNVDTGPEPFHDHEICLSLRTPNQTVSMHFYYCPDLISIHSIFCCRIHCCYAFAKHKTSMHHTNCVTLANQSWAIERDRLSFVPVWISLVPPRLWNF